MIILDGGFVISGNALNHVGFRAMNPDGETVYNEMDSQQKKRAMNPTWFIAPTGFEPVFSA